MSIEIFGIKTCDTCRKAIKALPDAQFRDIRATPLSKSEITELLEAFGDKLINRASTTWRGLDDDARSATPQDLLATHPALMKRPVIRSDAGLTLGFGKDVRAKLGLD